MIALRFGRHQSLSAGGNGSSGHPEEHRHGPRFRHLAREDSSELLVCAWNRSEFSSNAGRYWSLSTSSTSLTTRFTPATLLAIRLKASKSQASCTKPSIVTIPFFVVTVTCRSSTTGSDSNANATCRDTSSSGMIRLPVTVISARAFAGAAARCATDAAPQRSDSTATDAVKSCKNRYRRSADVSTIETLAPRRCSSAQCRPSRCKYAFFLGGAVSRLTSISAHPRSIDHQRPESVPTPSQEIDRISRRGCGSGAQTAPCGRDGGRNPRNITSKAHDLHRRIRVLMLMGQDVVRHRECTPTRR
jgi:hypothetical protein